jgi:hypothetical protein
MLILPEINQLTHRRAGFQRGETLIDLAELDAARDEVIELQPPLLPQRQEARHVDPEAVAAHHRALELAVAQEVEAVQRPKSSAICSSPIASRRSISSLLSMSAAVASGQADRLNQTPH